MPERNFLQEAYEDGYTDGYKNAQKAFQHLVERDDAFTVIYGADGWGACRCGYQMKYKPNNRQFCSRCGQRLKWRKKKE